MEEVSGVLLSQGLSFTGIAAEADGSGKGIQRLF
jgi:hypothetical protein